MTRKTLHLDPDLAAYLLRVGVNEHPLLTQLREETATHRLAKMQVAPEQGRLLAWLARLIGARRYLEIGVFTGYSSLAVALAMPDDAEIVACDVSELFAQVARRYWQMAGVEQRIRLVMQPALNTLDELLASGRQDSFDLAFIDADKPGTPDYYERCLRLVRPGGVIAVDNILLGGRVLHPQADDPPGVHIMRAFSENIATDKRVEQVMLPVGDGLTLLRRI